MSMKLLASGLLATMTFVAAPLAAAAWPERPVRIVVPYPPGGSADNVTRLLAKALSERTGQTVLVDNRAGGNGAIGTLAVLGAEPDGYTLGYGNINTLAINPALYKTLSYDPEAVAPVVEFMKTANLLLVSPASPLSSVEELVTQGRQRELTMGSAGNGTTPHLAGELLRLGADIRVLHVPYKGGAAALQDLMGGQLDFAFDNITTASELVKAGRLKALAIASPERLPQLENIPTFEELGIPNMEIEAWAGLVVPEGVDHATIQQINTLVNEALQTPALRDAYRRIGAVPLGGSVEAFADKLAQEKHRWVELVKDAGITVN